MKVCWNILICVWIGVIHGAVQVNDTFSLTISPLAPTDGELLNLTCSFLDETAVNIAWLQNNKTKVVTQKSTNCSKQALAEGNDITKRINVSCSSTAHSITFIFNSTTDQGSAWQCGKSVNDSYIYPRSNFNKIGPVTSTLSLSTTTRYMDQETVTTTDGTDEYDHTASPVMSTQSSSTITRNTEMTSDQETVTTKDASTGEKVPNLLYIAAGAVGGTVLLTIVVVGVVCIRRRRKAAHQRNDMKEERNNKASPVYQNTTGNNTVENDLFEGSHDVQPMNAAAKQEDDFMLSDGYASVGMPVTNTCTPRGEDPSGYVNFENLSPDYQNTTGNNAVSDIYTEVRKPKKKKQKE